MSAYYSMTPQLNFSVTDNMVPRYRYAKIPLNNLSSGSVPFNATSQTLVEIKIPASTCFNLSKSFITYQYTVPTPIATAGVFACAHESGLDFQQVFFGSGSGLGIVDMTYCNRYKKAVQNLRSTLDQDFLGGFNDQMTQFYPSRQPGQFNPYPQSIDGLTAGILNASPVNNTDAQQLSISALPSNAVAAGDPLLYTGPGALQVTRQIPLSVFKDTFLDMDKDVVFGSDMYLRLWTAATQQMCFWTTTPNNPHLGASNVTGAITGINFYLQLALEENIDIRNSLLMSLAKGSIRLDVPYTYCYRFSSTTQTANLSLTLTKNYGKSLNRILFVPFNGNEFSHLAYDHCNWNGSKVSQLQSTLNGRPLQDSIIQCYTPNIAPVAGITVNAFSQAATFGGVVDFAGDWRQIREFARGSCLQSHAHYFANWVWSDGWGIPPLVDEKNSGRPWYQNSEGLSLIDSGDLVYSLQASCPTVGVAASNIGGGLGLVLYLFCTFNRSLTIQSDGIVLSA
jgi:hypothetical protein